jgi:hypothetical protein
MGAARAFGNPRARAACLPVCTALRRQGFPVSSQGAAMTASVRCQGRAHRPGADSSSSSSTRAGRARCLQPATRPWQDLARQNDEAGSGTSKRRGRRSPLASRTDHVPASLTRSRVSPAAALARDRVSSRAPCQRVRSDQCCSYRLATRRSGPRDCGTWLAQLEWMRGQQIPALQRGCLAQRARALLVLSVVACAPSDVDTAGVPPPGSSGLEGQQRYVNCGSAAPGQERRVPFRHVSPRAGATAGPAPGCGTRPGSRPQ